MIWMKSKLLYEQRTKRLKGKAGSYDADVDLKGKNTAAGHPNRTFNTKYSQTA